MGGGPQQSKCDALIVVQVAMTTGADHKGLPIECPPAPLVAQMARRSSGAVHEPFPERDLATHSATAAIKMRIIVRRVVSAKGSICIFEDRVADGIQVVHALLLAIAKGDPAVKGHYMASLPIVS
jgi:hypothetical protein